VGWERRQIEDMLENERDCTNIIIMELIIFLNLPSLSGYHFNTSSMIAGWLECHEVVRLLVVYSRLQIRKAIRCRVKYLWGGCDGKR
jgi:hypothetical protein